MNKMELQLLCQPENFRRLRERSDYFSGLCRFESTNTAVGFPTCLGCPDRPLCRVTMQDWHYALKYLLSSRGNRQICSLTPLALYHIGLYLGSDTLLNLALCVLTPKDAPMFLQHISDLDHCRYVQHIISWYDDIENVIKRQVCLFCGGKIPNIKLPCCQVPVHYMCLESRIRGFLKYHCPKCNHLVSEIRPQTMYVSVRRPHRPLARHTGSSKSLSHTHNRQTQGAGASQHEDSPYSVMVRTFISKYHPNAEYLQAHLDMFVVLQKDEQSQRGHT